MIGREVELVLDKESSYKVVLNCSFGRPECNIRIEYADCACRGENTDLGCAIRIPKSNASKG